MGSAIVQLPNSGADIGWRSESQEAIGGLSCWREPALPLARLYAFMRLLVSLGAMVESQNTSERQFERADAAIEKFSIKD